MSRAGFVLVGGRSSRMGRNKALIPYGDLPLAERVARQVAAAAGSATLVGPPEQYRDLPYPVVGDVRPGNGPLGGVETALMNSEAEWNLIVACDMPNVSATLLASLLNRAEQEGAECLVPLSQAGRAEPLCAVWRSGCLGDVREALDAGVRKMADALGRLDVATWQPDVPGWAVNLNTPEDWRRQTGSDSHE